MAEILKSNDVGVALAEFSDQQIEQGDNSNTGMVMMQGAFCFMSFFLNKKGPKNQGPTEI